MPGSNAPLGTRGGTATAQQPPVGFDQRTAEAIVAAAGRAPSIHNTQPWRWHLVGGELRLRADPSRQLAVADPDGHSMLISCGAALHLALVAAEAAGRPTQVIRFPEEDDVHLLARVVPQPPTKPVADRITELQAALTRASDRRPFGREPLADADLEQLRQAAAVDVAYLDFPHGQERLITLAVAVSWADRIERDDEAAQAEMRQWLRDPAVHADPVDGVVASAVPHVEPGHQRHNDVPMRDFELGVRGDLLIRQDADERAALAVIMTEADNARDHLASGEAMMRAMIAAQRRGLASCPVSQPVDQAAFRTHLQGLMGWVGIPQMMLRIGHPDGALLSPTSPRRPVAEVLQLDSA